MPTLWECSSIRPWSLRYTDKVRAEQLPQQHPQLVARANSRRVLVPLLQPLNNRIQTRDTRTILIMAKANGAIRDGTPP